MTARRRARIRVRACGCGDLAELVERWGDPPPGAPLPLGSLAGREHVQTCRRCGCDDFDCAACIERTGAPCWWAEPALCSACAAEIGA